MKKILALILAAATVAMVMTSCTVSVKKDSDADSVSSEVVSDDVSSDPSEGTTKVGDIEISNSVSSGQIAVDGKLYTLPCKLSEFLDDGWTSKYDDDMLKANTKLIPALSFSKDDNKKIKIMIMNFSMDEELPYKECYAVEVEAYLDCGVEIILPRGVKFDESLTIEGAQEIYGTPDYVYNSDKNDVIHYNGESAFEKVKITIYKPDSNMVKYSSVLVENCVRENVRD